MLLRLHLRMGGRTDTHGYGRIDFRLWFSEGCGLARICPFMSFIKSMAFQNLGVPSLLCKHTVILNGINTSKPVLGITVLKKATHITEQHCQRRHYVLFHHVLTHLMSPTCTQVPVKTEAHILFSERIIRVTIV